MKFDCLCNGINGLICGTLLFLQALSKAKVPVAKDAEFHFDFLARSLI